MYRRAKTAHGHRSVVDGSSRNSAGSNAHRERDGALGHLQPAWQPVSSPTGSRHSTTSGRTSRRGRRAASTGPPSSPRLPASIASSWTWPRAGSGWWRRRPTGTPCTSVPARAVPRRVLRPRLPGWEDLIASQEAKDLVEDFDASFANLCTLTGVDPFRPEPAEPNSSFRDAGGGIGDVNCRWRSRSPERGRTFERYAGRQLLAWGTPPRTGRGGLLTRAEWAGRYANPEVRERIRRLHRQLRSSARSLLLFVRSNGAGAPPASPSPHSVSPSPSPPRRTYGSARAPRFWKGSA
jgi:hypothetical protein